MKMARNGIRSYTEADGLRGTLFVSLFAPLRRHAFHGDTVAAQWHLRS
jgi:hypothetical protein